MVHLFARFSLVVPWKGDWETLKCNIIRTLILNKKGVSDEIILHCTVLLSRLTLVVGM